MNNKSGSEMGELVDKDILKRISEYWGGKFCGDAVGIKTLWNNASSDIDLLLSHAAHLQKLCEEQKRELEVERGISMSKNTELLEMSRKIEEQKGEIERLNRLLELTRNKWNEDLAKEGRVVLLQSQLAEKEKEIAELKFVIMQRDAELTMRNDQLDKVRFQSDIYAKQVVLKEELINERSSQLATQTERIKELEHVVEVANKFTPYDKSLEWCKYADGSWHHVVIVDKVLYTDGIETGRFEAPNQDSLGDGK